MAEKFLKTLNMSVYEIQLARSKKCHQTTLGNPKNSFSMTDCFVQLQLQLHKFSDHESGFCFSQTVVYFCLSHTHTHTQTRLTALFPGLPGWAGTRKVKPIWIILEQETVGGSGISWAICKSAPRFRRITTPAPHHRRRHSAANPQAAVAAVDRRDRRAEGRSTVARTRRRIHPIPRQKNLQFRPPPNACQIVYSESFFGRDNELHIFHGNCLLMDNKHRKLFVITQ